MKNLKIFCTSIDYYKVIDYLPNIIIPLGIGKNTFPSNWLDEKKGENISELNSYYGELTGLYWVWKNKLIDMKKDDLIGNCHYRKLWLNDFYTKSKLDIEVVKVAKKIASKSNLTIKIGKKAFYKQLEMPIKKAYAYTSKMMTVNMMSIDAKEGISAFLEKRKPNWKHK